MKFLQSLVPGDLLRVASADASGTDFKREVDGEISRLAKLGKLEYEHERRDVARRLEVRAPVLDRWVAAPAKPFSVLWRRSARMTIPPELPCLQISVLSASALIGRIDEHGNTNGLGHQLMQES